MEEEDAAADPYLPYDGGGDTIPLQEIPKKGTQHHGRVPPSSRPCREPSPPSLTDSVASARQRTSVTDIHTGPTKHHVRRRRSLDMK